MDATIGKRVAALIPARGQAQVAAAVGMGADALSRALSGQRGFGAGELARIADYFGADLHELITGEPDPHRVKMVARHDYDQETGERSVPGRAADEPVLEDIVLAYRQAPPPPRPQWRPPADVAAARAALGAGFVRPFIDRIEERLGIDVVRVAELSTAYSFIVEDRAVIAVPAVASWFWENFSLAHELGHLVLQHHAAEATHQAHEAAAHAFAAELLMPAELLRSSSWADLDAGQLAARVWDLGVSTEALAIRLESLGIECAVAQEWRPRDRKTQKLLRRHWTPTEPGDPITRRMDDAAPRRFPVALQAAHQEQIAAGQIGKGTLAWMLGVAPDRLEVDEPERAEMSTADLAAALELL